MTQQGNKSDQAGKNQQAGAVRQLKNELVSTRATLQDKVEQLKGLNEELRAAEERTRHLASFPQVNPNPVLEVASSGRVIYSNPGSQAVLTSLGLDRGDVEAFLPADMDAILRALARKAEAFLYREVVLKDRIFGATVHLVPQFDVARIYAFDITEQKRAEDALRQSEARLQRAQEIAHLGSWELDLTNNVLTWSDEVYRIFGLQPQEFDASYEAFLESVHPDDRAAVDEAYSDSLSAGSDSYEIEHRVVRKSTGEVRYVHEKCEHFRDETGRIIRSVGMVHDITDRKKAEAELHRLNKTLKALGNSRQALIRAEDEAGYLNDVCRVIVEDCGYSMVWIGFAEDDEDKTVRPVAHAGYEEGYLQTLRVSWADKERGQGPTGTAIRNGKVAVCRNMRTDSAFTPWSEQALKRGYSSSIVFPLLAGGRAFGAISIYSRETDPFTEGEMKLLAELADDTAYGIKALRVRLAHTEAELNLRKKEAKLQTIFDNLTEGLVVADLSGNQFHWNPVAMAMHGFDRMAECQRNLSEFKDIFELSTVEAGILPFEEWPLSRILRGETLHGWEVRVRRYNADWQRVFSYGGTLVRDNDGKPLLAIVTLADITKRKRYEEALLKAKQEWERTFDAVPDLIALLDKQYRIVRVNRAMAERLGLTPDQCVGLTCFTCVHGTLEPPEFCPHTWTLKDGNQHEVEVHEERFGSDFLVTTTPMFNEDGTLAGTVHVARDITERKRAEEEVKKLNADLNNSVIQLEVANRELEAFSYSVSHDLRAPLRSIAGFSQALKEDYKGRLDEEGRDCLDRILQGTQRMGRIIDDLLNLSRVTRAAMRKARVNLSEEATRIATRLGKSQPERQVDFIIAPEVTAAGDEQLLSIALENLLGNAFKFTAKQPAAKIEFGTTEHDSSRVYFVKDNGAGFDMEYSGKLFQPFQRLHSQHEFAGTGIGLATVRRIIDRHGGRVWIKGEPDKGAIVYFTLEVHTEEQTGEQSA